MIRRIVMIGLLAALAALPAAAQQRPLVTEDPETVGPGMILIEGGFDYGTNVLFPASGLQGNLLRAPILGVSIGISSIAEFQLDGGPYDRLSVKNRLDGPLAKMINFTGDTTHDVDDIVVGTKIKIVPEAAGHPSFGVRFSTRLPNAGNESGLGLDTTDFHFDGLVAKTVQSVRVVGNIGLGILGDPTRGDNQNDVLDYGLSVARAVREGVEIVGEINGRANTRGGTPPVGTESRGILRFGSRWTHGPVRLDAGILLGMTSRDPGVGITAGATWVFKAFDLK